MPSAKVLPFCSGLNVLKMMLGVKLPYSVANSGWWQIKQRATCECNDRDIFWWHCLLFAVGMGWIH